MKQENTVKAYCSKCKHFVITWNTKYPYACKLLGFKSADVPSSVAYDSTGKTCEGFEPKIPNKNRGQNTKSKSGGEDSVIVTIGNREEHYP